MPSGGVRRGKDIVPDPRTRPASFRARRRALRGKDVRRERARRRARGLQRERRIAVAPVDIRRRRLGLRGDRALQRRGEAAQRVGARARPAGASSRRQVVVTASPSLACCGPRFCFCFFAWSPRTPARGEAREASPSSALSTSGRRSRARCASVVAGAKSAPPRVRHALSACARVTGRCPSSRFASASPASALPRNVTTACSSPLGDMSCGHRRSSSRKICAVRFAASPSRLAPASSASSLAAAASGRGEPLLVQVHELLVD